MSDPPVMFRRDAFYGDFRDTVPKWHVASKVPTDKYGTYVAHCGYTQSNILGGLMVSRSKKRKTHAETCAKCVKAIAKAEAAAVSETNQ